MSFLSSLSFVSPFILTALIALPALWFLLRAIPPSPKLQKFPAFNLLLNLSTTKETPQNTPWWLLFIRLLICSLIILGLAGPHINAVKKTSSTRPILLIVDDSWTNAQSWQKIKDALLETAAEIQGTNRVAFLIRTSDGVTPPKPLTAALLRRETKSISPKPIYPNHSETLSVLDTFKTGPYEIKWMSDGLQYVGTSALLDRLKKLGSLIIFVDQEDPRIAIQKSNISEQFNLISYGKNSKFNGSVTILAKDGRELSRQLVVIEKTTQQTSIEFDLPLSIRNDAAIVRLENVPSAGAVHLIDARSRRVLVGFLSTQSLEDTSLLSGNFYIRKALEPHADFLVESIENLVRSDATVIVLNDTGRLRESDVAVLSSWIEEGGILLRFAGNSLADAAQSGNIKLLPVELRGGDRAFGGALSWETPQPIGSFSFDGPFASLTTPEDTFVRKQVLASPGGDTSAVTWASLQDGTPLVTGKKLGSGAIVLFHVSSTPDWSDLPLSRTFVDMLRKTTQLSNLTVATEKAEKPSVHAPISILDGFGNFEKPPSTLEGIQFPILSENQSAPFLPGFYGVPEAPFTINAVKQDDRFTKLNIVGVKTQPFAAKPPILFAPIFFSAAIILFFLDCIIFFIMNRKSKFHMTAVIVSLISVNIILSATKEVYAQPLDTVVDTKTVAASLETRLAYVKTGDNTVDRISTLGLSYLSQQLARRTAIEPGPPTAVNLESDDLSVYPLLYWPMSGDALMVSDTALSNVETFMRQGGLVMFDTRDDERALSGVDTPERMALQRILRNIDTPPLKPLQDDHVLTRSFYLLDDLRGRFNGNPIWVQSNATANDAVTSIIIGGRDWAGAWARDERSRPILPMGRGGERAREISVRSGINVVMVALTGNYKSDQVHTPILLKRLGK